MVDAKVNGLGVALVTPFNKSLSPDFPALEKLIEHVIAGGVDYIVALGTTAETPSLSFEEKIELAEFIKLKVQGRVPLVIGIGGNNTMRIIKELETLDLNGYSAILSVVPYYNKPTQEGIFLHFSKIVEASPLPIILYNVPGRTGVNMTANTTVRLANLSDKFCGIKEASGNMLQAQEIIEKSPGHFSMISGNDSDTFSIMKNGGKGVISVLANAFPDEMKTLVDLCAKKDFVQAQRYQQTLTPFINHLFEDGNPAGIKAVLEKIGICENYLRLPLVPVSRKVKQKLYHDTTLLLGFDD